MSALAQQPRPLGHRNRPPALALAAALTLAAALAVWLLVAGSSGGGPPEDPAATAAARAAFFERTGVRLTRVAVTGGGGLVDLRVRVIDADKAPIVTDRPPALIDEETGERLDELLMNHNPLAHAKLRAGVGYYLVFVNRRGVVEPGRRVTVVLGGVRFPHVRVM